MANDDGDWKPSGRPTSMIARNFSADLNDAFAIDSNLDGLVQSVQLKKEKVNSQTQELQALEARLRDTEERLKGDPSPAGRNDGAKSLNKLQPLGNTYSGHEKDQLEFSTISPQATQAPTSQSVSASTMSHWRPTQNTASGTGGGDVAFARPSGQKNSCYVK